MLLGPEGASQGRGPDREHPGEEAQAGEGAVHHVAPTPGARFKPAQGPEGFQDQQQDKDAGDQKG